MMRERSDLQFFFITKRPERFFIGLPDDWGDGWENVMFNVTCENQRRTDERIPILLSLPFKHKGIMCAPLIGAVSIEKYLGDGQIEQVICGGENYDGARPCDFGWVKALRAECVAHDITFCFIETGTVFIKDGGSDDRGVTQRKLLRRKYAPRVRPQRGFHTPGELPKAVLQNPESRGDQTQGPAQSTPYFL